MAASNFIDEINTIFDDSIDVITKSKNLSEKINESVIKIISCLKNNGKVILTQEKHPTGTDRIYEALQKLQIKDVDLIMNLQGDEPAINIEDIINLNKKMINNRLNNGSV